MWDHRGKCQGREQHLRTTCDQGRSYREDRSIGSIIDDVYTVVDDHTEVGGGSDVQRGESRSEVNERKKKSANRQHTRSQCPESRANACPRANGRDVCPYLRESL